MVVGAAGVFLSSVVWDGGGTDTALDSSAFTGLVVPLLSVGGTTAPPPAGLEVAAGGGPVELFVA